MPVTDEDGYVWITAGDYDQAIKEGRAKRVPNGWGVISGFYWVPEFTPGILRGLRIVKGDNPYREKEEEDKGRIFSKSVRKEIEGVIQELVRGQTGEAGSLLLPRGLLISMTVDQIEEIIEREEINE